MQHKHKWSTQDCDNINWGALKLALCIDRQCLQECLHAWLPLQGAPHMIQLASNTSCLVCHGAPEKFWHFLECQHQSCKGAYLQLQTAIRQIHKENHVDPHMLQLMWQGLNSIHQQYPIEDQCKTYPTEFQNLFTDQSQIEWDHLFYGITSSLWHSTLSTQHSTGPKELFLLTNHYTSLEVHPHLLDNLQCSTTPQPTKPADSTVLSPTSVPPLSCHRQ